MNSVIVIPARMASTRFPNKPLAPILGKIMLERVWRIARAVPGVNQILIATDDLGLSQVAEGFGATVVMTRPECSNGSERAWDAVQQLSVRPDLVINLQGDAVLTPPWVIESVLRQMAAEGPGAEIATPAVQLTWAECAEFSRARAAGDTSGTFVVMGVSGQALYFSKSVIPFAREQSQASGTDLSPVYRHIGLYVYRYSALGQYVDLAPTPLEKIEKLEQLRALENNIPIQVVPVDYRGRTHASVDEPKDVTVVEQVIRREGELVEWI